MWFKLMVIWPALNNFPSCSLGLSRPKWGHKQKVKISERRVNAADKRLSSNTNTTIIPNRCWLHAKKSMTQLSVSTLSPSVVDKSEQPKLCLFHWLCLLQTSTNKCAISFQRSWTVDIMNSTNISSGTSLSCEMCSRCEQCDNLIILFQRWFQSVSVILYANGG